MVFHGNSEVQGQSLTRGSVYVGDHLVVENGVDVTRGEMGVKLKSSAERALKYTTDPGRFPINSISYSPDEIIVSLITEANITQDSIVIFLDVDRSCSALGNTRQVFAVKAQRRQKCSSKGVRQCSVWQTAPKRGRSK